VSEYRGPLRRTIEDRILAVEAERDALQAEVERLEIGYDEDVDALATELIEERIRVEQLERALKECKQNGFLHPDQRRTDK
jgi:hypothetical protein